MLILFQTILELKVEPLCSIQSEKVVISICQYFNLLRAICSFVSIIAFTFSVWLAFTISTAIAHEIAHRYKWLTMFFFLFLAFKWSVLNVVLDHLLWCHHLSCGNEMTSFWNCKMGELVDTIVSVITTYSKVSIRVFYIINLSTLFEEIRW